MLIRKNTGRLLPSDPQLLSDAGPAVLRLKLMEMTHLVESRQCPENIRRIAQEAADELRRLIIERPCVSIIDHLAKGQIAGTFDRELIPTEPSCMSAPPLQTDARSGIVADYPNKASKSSCVEVGYAEREIKPRISA